MYRLLIVEDELSTRKWFKHMIQWQEFNFELVAVVEDGLEAWARLERDSCIDAVLTDIRMPYMDGLELTSRIREADLPVEVIISSGFGEFEYARQAIKLEVSAYLLKPITKEQLQIEFEKLRTKMDEKQVRRHELLQASLMKREIENKTKLEWYERVLIRGEPVANLEQTWADTNRALSGHPYITIIAEIDHYREFTRSHSKEDQMLCRFLVQNILRDIANAYGCTECVSILENRYLFIIPLQSEQTVECTHEIAHQFRSALKEYLKLFDITISVGGSTAAHALDELPLAYQQAVRALEHKFFLGLTSMANIQEISGWNDKCCYPFELEKRLSQHLKQNETDSISGDLQFFYDTFQHQGTPGGIKIIAGELLVQIYKHLIELKSMSTRSEIMSSLIQQIDHMETAQDVADKMNELIEWIVNTVRMEGVQLSPIAKGIEYIKLNLSKEISLQEVAAYSGHSASYFSTQFKQEQGQNFIDFLVGLRMEKAQQLLETTKMTIAQIGEQVGYHSYRYFSKVFKEHNGVTPTQYREQIHSQLYR